MEQTATKIVQTLQQAGFTAYFAGGAVRDMLLGLPAEDIDIATSARPEEIEALFARTFSIGKHFGVILVQENGHHFEIATFRSDGGYSDGRRPDAVFFTTPEEDAKRRDFSMNALFYDPIQGQIFDFVGGHSDLEAKILRFIGNPEERIREDYLRILRAVRFKNRFGLRFDPHTAAALQAHASLILGVSAERVQTELSKMIIHPSREQAFRDLQQLEILEHILPELSALEKTPQPENYHAEGNALTHSFLALGKLPKTVTVELAWATLWHDIGKAPTISYQENRIRFPDHAVVGATVAEKILKRLKFNKFAQGKIRWLIAHHHLLDQFFEMKHSTKLHYFDDPFFEDLLLLHRADLFGCIPAEPKYHQEGEAELQRIEAEYAHAHFENLLPSAQPELLSGAELMEILKIRAGRKIGEIKAALREEQLNRRILSKADAIAWVRGNFSS